MPHEPRIAILPFSNLSADPQLDYFSEGIAVEMLVGLTRIPGLHLVSRSAVFALDRDALSIGEIGRELDATIILCGAAELSDDHLHLTVELFDAGTEEERWSGVFDCDLKGILPVLDEIITQVAAACQVDTLPETVRSVQSTHSSDVDAYHYYLRGRRLYYQFSRQGVEAALEMFRKAAELDEHYALAYCGIADSYSYLYQYVESTAENLEQADAASRRALELDPMLAEAHASRGQALALKCLYDEATADFDRAVELDPKLFEARYLYARMCFAKGDLEKAARLYREAHEARPEDYQCLLLSGQIYDSLDRPEDAASVRRQGLAVVEKHLAKNPDDVRALYMGANGLAALGEVEKSKAWLQHAISLQPDDPMLLYNAGCIYAILGETDEALKCLERSVGTGLTQKEWYEQDSNLDPLRTHPRFIAMMERMG